MGPIRVPLRLAASAIIQRQHAPPLAGERRREAREIVGGTRQAGKTNDRSADAPAGIVEIVKAQAVGGGEETVGRLANGLGHLGRLAVEDFPTRLVALRPTIAKPKVFLSPAAADMTNRLPRISNGFVTAPIRGATN